MYATCDLSAFKEGSRKLVVLVYKKNCQNHQMRSAIKQSARKKYNNNCGHQAVVCGTNHGL